jgi:eukaryotic-like serine/threonine-protein kinase
MSDLPWSRVEEIYHAALERSPELRAAFLAEICASDFELRREVESLLAQSGDAMDTSAWVHITANQELWRQTPLLQAGTALGPYKIMRRIGAGGMREVYLGRDKRLNRLVALKVLPAYLRLDPARKKRFEREVKTISALNHPHICTVYDTGEQDGIDFFVMEYLEGDTLAKRLERGPLPIERVLRHSIEIADALSQAHVHGIIHRDLKPANIILTKSGAKLLDFGLSKVQSAVGTSDESSDTAKGTILGTLQYMAPEQLEGKEADARSDIFSFGAIMYEMATGYKAYKGGSQAGLISAIMTSEPQPITKIQPSIPAAFDDLVRICQAKDPGSRWQSVHDVLLQLRSIALRASATDRASTHQARTTGRKWLTATCATLLIIATVLFAIRSRKQLPIARQVRLAINPPKGLQFVESDWPAISPDGRTVVLSSQRVR